MIKTNGEVRCTNRQARALKLDTNYRNTESLFNGTNWIVATGIGWTVIAGICNNPSMMTIFETSRFMPHGHCYLWRPQILWLHVFSDSLIALSYFTIPIALVYFVRQRADLRYHWIFLLFAAFIFSCGATHVFGIWTIWNPDYGAEGMLKLMTGIVSASTAVALWFLIPRALAIPSRTELEHEVERRTEAERKVLEINAELEDRVAERTEELSLEIEERRKTETELALLSSELDHRVRNVFSIVLALIRLSRRSDGVELDSAQLKQRIFALAEVHSHLNRGNWQETEVGALVELALRPYNSKEAQGAVTIGGPQVALTAQQAEYLYLALHELATNAAKYGSLSSSDGKLEVLWNIEKAQDAMVLVLTWREQGASVPPATETHTGFGSQLIQTVAAALKGIFKREFVQDGVQAELSFEVASVHNKSSTQPKQI